MPQWKWRTFPVFCALVAGILIASVANGVPDNAAAAVLQIAALGGVGYAIAHLFVTNVIIAGRIRRRDALASVAPEATDDEWVDEIVHPTEPPARD